MNIAEQRARALEIIREKTTKCEYTLIDYHLDTECRTLLKLPERPVGSLPYQGWMIGDREDALTTKKPSDNCINLIKKWESFRGQAYLCPAGKWTIGYGHTATAQPGMYVTHLEATQLLASDLARFAHAVNRLVTVPLTQGQFDALVSFTFNVGINYFQQTSLLKAVNKSQYEVAAEWFKRYVYAKKTRLPGLVKRRQEERELFES